MSDDADGLAELKRNLHKAFHDPLKGKPDPLVERQTRYAVALGHVAIFLRNLGVDEASEFSRLARIFLDLADGTPNATVTVIKPTNQDRHEIWEARKVAALGLLCYLDCMSRSDAASEAVTVASTLDRLITRRSELTKLSTSLLGWHDRFLHGRAPQPAQGSYSKLSAELRQTLVGMKRAPKIARGEEYLKSAERMAEGVLFQARQPR